MAKRASTFCLPADAKIVESNDFLATYINNDDYLLQRFGIAPTPMRGWPRLGLDEQQYIKDKLVLLLQLLDEHLSYWKTTRAFRRIARLQDVLNMLSGLQYAPI